MSLNRRGNLLFSKQLTRPASFKMSWRLSSVFHGRRRPKQKTRYYRNVGGRHKRRRVRLSIKFLSPRMAAPVRRSFFSKSTKALAADSNGSSEDYLDPTGVSPCPVLMALVSAVCEQLPILSGVDTRVETQYRNEPARRDDAIGLEAAYVSCQIQLTPY